MVTDQDGRSRTGCTARWERRAANSARTQSLYRTGIFAGRGADLDFPLDRLRLIMYIMLRTDSGFLAGLAVRASLHPAFGPHRRRSATAPRASRLWSQAVRRSIGN